MKNNRTLFGALILLLSFTSCKKDDFLSSDIASVNIINASIDVPAYYVYFTFADSNYYLQQNPLYFASGANYALLPGSSPVSLVSVSDTLKPYFSTTINVQNTGIYSLYISGTGRNVDTLFLKDNIPFYTDSVAGVRFINLSPGSAPVSVNLAGNDPSQKEFSGLGYQQISDFKAYRAISGTNNYSFEIHDEATGNPIATYDFSFKGMFKSYTLVICGSQDPASSTPVSVFAVSNF